MVAHLHAWPGCKIKRISTATAHKRSDIPGSYTQDGFTRAHYNTLNFFLNLRSGGWNQGPLDTAATNGLLCQPRVIMIIEKSVE
jgi:hypothetical protein